MDKAIGSDGAGHANDETCNMYVVCRVNMYELQLGLDMVAYSWVQFRRVRFRRARFRRAQFISVQFLGLLAQCLLCRVFQ